MNDLGRAVAEGISGFGETLDELMSAHIRLFGCPGTPGSLHRLEERLTQRLIEVTERHADPNVREWYRPRVLPERKTGYEHDNGIDH